MTTRTNDGDVNWNSELVREIALAGGEVEFFISTTQCVSPGGSNTSPNSFPMISGVRVDFPLN